MNPKQRTEITGKLGSFNSPETGATAHLLGGSIGAMPISEEIDGGKRLLDRKGLANATAVAVAMTLAFQLKIPGESLEILVKSMEIQWNPWKSPVFPGKSGSD